MEKKVYRSRISVLLIVIILVFCLPVLIRMIIVYSGFYIIAGIFGIFMVFALLALRSVYYVLTDKEMQIYYLWGIISKPFGKIDISAITSVERSYISMYSTAASLKKMRFHFKTGYKGYCPWGYDLLISPVREQEFLETLKTLNPNIQINVTNKTGWWRIWDWDV